jgi:hypothetical protein
MDKKYIWIGIGIFVFVVLVCGILSVFMNTSTRQQAEPLSTPVMLATATSMVTLTPTPTVTPVAPGIIWEVVSIEEHIIYENGFYYDVATFRNLNDPSVLIQARCAEPGWPQPEVGQQYVLNQYGVLIPIEGIESKLQRFLVIETVSN